MQACAIQSAQNIFPQGVGRIPPEKGAGEFKCAGQQLTGADSRPVHQPCGLVAEIELNLFANAASHAHPERDDDGRVAWDQMWQGFCELALAGGPPHRGTLLEAVAPEAALANPERYAEVRAELARGMLMVTGLPVELYGPACIPAILDGMEDSFTETIEIPDRLWRATGQRATPCSPPGTSG